MIIVSQDKEIIINFEKVNIININQLNKKQIGAWFNCNEEENDNVLLGEYATEERAKEVLQEISSTFAIKGVRNANYQCADIWIKMRQHAIYEMPKE